MALAPVNRYGFSLTESLTAIQLFSRSRKDFNADP